MKAPNQAYSLIGRTQAVISKPSFTFLFWFSGTRYNRRRNFGGLGGFGSKPPNEIPAVLLTMYQFL